MSTENPRIEVVSTPLFKKLNGKMQQAVDVSLYGFADKTATTVSLSGSGIEEAVNLELRRDHLFGRVLIPEIVKPIEVVAKIEGNDLYASGTFELKPKKKWRIHILHFSHTDTGYTDLPSRVARNHGRFLKEILDYCKETDVKVRVFII